MHIPFVASLAATALTFSSFVSGQQFAGNAVNNSLLVVPGAEISYWKIQDSSSRKINMTLINYQNLGKNGKRQVPANLKRAIIFVHGLQRDPGTYQSNMLSALAALKSSTINTDSVAVVTPYFPNGDDKYTGYPFTDGLDAGRGSTSDCLVWKSSQWSAGGNNQYPYKSKVMSSFAVLDQMVQYFDNKTLFPNLNQIVIGGHSLGAQTVQRYAAISQITTVTPVSHWIGNPNSYTWLNSSRPFDTGSCSDYDEYRDGYSNFTDYPMTYGTSLVAAGSSAIIANWNSKQIAFGRGMADYGDDSSSCSPFTQGANRNERMFTYLQSFPLSCSNPAGHNCDTVDLVPGVGHDASGMMQSAGGSARLFIDNFNGDNARAYDFGYPRQLANNQDDPYPDPALVGTPIPSDNNTYPGGYTSQGCWTDQSPLSLTNRTYVSSANTVDMCIAACASGNNSIAGMELGNQCWCGSSLGYQAQPIVRSSCNIACPGNANQLCGGNFRLSLYSIGTPKVNPKPQVPATVGNFTSQGCYTEASSGRALGGAATSGSSVDIEYCAKYCGSYKYFGVEYGNECYCGNTLASSSNSTAAGECSMYCAHNVAEFCGDANRLNLYLNPNYVPSATSSPSTGGGATPTGVSCPSYNGQVVTSNGKNFTIECGVDHQGGDLTSTTVTSFQGCIDACSANSQCVDVALSGSACYLKSSVGAAVNNANIYGAKLITGASTSTSTSASSVSVSTGVVSTSSTSAPTSTSTALSCPASNGATYNTTNGNSYIIECGTDHQAGDIGSVSVSSLEQCIAACDAKTGCVDVSLYGAGCYLKGSVGTTIANANVNGARLVTGQSVSSSASSSAATSTAAVVSTSSATASPTASAISCPASNATTYTSGNGAQFVVECGIDHQGGDMKNVQVSGLQACADACANTVGCVDASLSGAVCYLKSTLGAAVSNGVQGVRLINGAATSSSAVATSSSTVAATTSSAVAAVTTSTSSISASTSSVSASTSSVSASTSSASASTLSTSTTSSAAASATSTLACPASNNTLYTASNKTFLIECGIDHQGGDMSSLTVSSFTQCVQACDSTPGCVDVSLSGVACYLKKSLGAAVSAPNILGAKVVATVSSSTSSAAVTSSATP